MRKLQTIVWMLCLVFLAGCSDSDNGTLIKEIKISSSLEIKVEEGSTLSVQVLPENSAEEAKLVWKSSDESVVAVDQTGRLSALKVGEAVVSVELVRNSNVRSECLVTVTDEEKEEGVDYNRIVEFEDPLLSILMLKYDSNNDGKLQFKEALMIRELLVGFSNIKSLKGLENLENLVLLSAPGNQLTSVDLSANKKLTYVYLHSNIIETLDVSDLELLQELNCSANRLSAIDVTNNPNLKMLDISLNHEGRGNNSGITELDVTHNTKLEKLDLNYTNVSELDLSKNTELKWIDFGLTSYTSPNTQPITKIDFSNNLKLEHIGCEAMIRTYDMDGNLVEDRVGLSKMDVSMLSELQSLSFPGNSIKNIDLSKNLKLTSLNCSHNYIEDLDVTYNDKLEKLVCDWNKLSSLDLSKSSSLEHLDCANNQIDKLDISNTRMSYLLGNNNNITEFNLGNKVFDTPGGNDKKPYLYLKLNNNKISSIDVSKQVNLAWLEINNNELTSLDISSCTNLGGVLLNNNKVSTLNISNITHIWEVQATNNKLSGTIDLSHLSLSRLDLEGNPDLKSILVWSDFKEDCNQLIVDHTTGSTISRKCYTKDDTASWVKK
ncbi:Ig-like domain-containing protein [Proteiniphilum sp. UBA5384]|uniref:Ig-like domain-containing protein n=1 Tax=Proteiniphilum sp. UBA5384 TaxID=1947279 RepID=UPI0025EFE2DB|nr:Ig-like domain-containing protein [Proteiniphilum sp. UBA5384]